MILKSHLVLLFLSILGLCCTSMKDEIYCADVNRYNPNTQFEATYRLKVKIEKGKLVQINWPSGGHIDAKDFLPPKISDSKTTFSDFDGIQYSIVLAENGLDCFGNVPLARRCKGITLKGTRCENMTDNVNVFCHHHNN